MSLPVETEPSDAALLADVRDIIHSLPVLFASFTPGASSDDPVRKQLDDVLFELRKSCADSSLVQHTLVAKLDAATLRPLLLLNIDSPAPAKSDVRTSWSCWALLSNVCADNATTTAQIWSAFRTVLLEALRAEPVEPDGIIDVCHYIIYLCLLYDVLQPEDWFTVLQLLIVHLRRACESKAATVPVHLQLCLEHYYRLDGLVPLYSRLQSSDRAEFLHFIADEYRVDGAHDDDNLVPGLPAEERLKPDMVAHLCERFKRTSDCVLKTVASHVDNVLGDPRETMALLTVLTILTTDDQHLDVLQQDASLFLNVSGLLMAVVAAGQQATADNAFAALSKLEQVAPNSPAAVRVETEVTYNLKTMLLQALGNLAYRSSRNRELARDLHVLPAVLNCTGMDARNPMMKEFAVLAIKYLCRDSAENQAIIAGLVRQGNGVVDRSGVLREVDLEMGMLRIGGSEKASK